MIKVFFLTSPSSINGYNYSILISFGSVKAPCLCLFGTSLIDRIDRTESNLLDFLCNRNKR